MGQYKYLFERPVADIYASGKLMDFDSLLAKSLKTRRYRLIRNTALTTALVSTLIFGIFYFSRNDKPGPIKSQPSMPLQSSDSGVQKIEKNENGNGRQDTSGKSLQNGNKNDTIKPENNIPGKMLPDTFKIRESFSEEEAVIRAEPVDGFDALYKYFNEKLTYPEDLKHQKIEGKVVVAFLIGKDGKVMEVTILQSLHPVLDSLAAECVGNMPPWKPASVNGEPVDSKHSIPLTFSFESK